MSKRSLTEYTCDECGIEIIAEKVPQGWVRLLSVKSTDRNRIMFHGPLPAVWSPQSSRHLPEDGLWCSARCLSDYVHRIAEEVIERAKLNH